jgi:hypothetical protein
MSDFKVEYGDSVQSTSISVVTFTSDIEVTMKDKDFGDVRYISMNLDYDDVLYLWNVLGDWLNE